MLSLFLVFVSHALNLCERYHKRVTVPYGTVVCVSRAARLTLSGCVPSHLGHAQLFVTLWTVARQAALSTGLRNNVDLQMHSQKGTRLYVGLIVY